MADRPKGAIIQRDKKTYAVVPRTPMGLVTPYTLQNKDGSIHRAHRY